MSQLDQIDTVNLLREIMHELLPDLCKIVWRYVEPLYTCHSCSKEVSWSTVMSWNQGKVEIPEGVDDPIVYCSEVCTFEGFHTKIYCHTVPGSCVVCYWRSTHRDSDNHFYPYPTTPCLLPNECRINHVAD